MKKTTTPTHAKSPCSCHGQLPLCGNCIQFKSKLRNGLFKHRVCTQDEQGNVLIAQCASDGKKESERFLFSNFKKITEVAKLSSEIYFLTVDENETFYRILYKYKGNKKFIQHKNNKGL